MDIGDALAADADPKSGFVMQPAISLAKKNLDLFGNRVFYRQYASGATFIRYTNKPGATYWIVASTGRANRFFGKGTAAAPRPELEATGFSQVRPSPSP